MKSRAGATLGLFSLLTACTGDGQTPREPAPSADAAPQVRRDAAARLDSAPTPFEEKDAAVVTSDAAVGTDSAARDTRGPDVTTTAPDGGTDTRSQGMLEAKLHQLTFKANEADPAATELLQPQIVLVDGRVPSVGKLVVYLVGKSNLPSNGAVAANEFAALGMHVFVPHYQNDYDIAGPCGSGTDTDCHRKARLEALEGIDHSPLITVMPAESIERRIVKAMAYAQTKVPGGDWGRFVDGDRPRWSEIVIAGQSHGASAAGLIGKVRSTHRVLMTAGPFDNRKGAPAPWTMLPSMTPEARFFGFSHQQDPQHEGHVRDWGAMGMGSFGAPTSVDGMQPPYGGSHQLTTNVTSTNPHGCVAGACKGPGGAFLFRNVYKYMLGL